MNQFEDPIDALHREVKEETGLEVNVIKPISVFHIFRGEEKAENELVGIIFWCQAKNTNVVLSEEHASYKWTNAKEAYKIMEKPGMKKDIQAFINEKAKET